MERFHRQIQIFLFYSGCRVVQSLAFGIYPNSAPTKGGNYSENPWPPPPRPAYQRHWQQKCIHPLCIVLWNGWGGGLVWRLSCCSTWKTWVSCGLKERETQLKLVMWRSPSLSVPACKSGLGRSEGAASIPTGCWANSQLCHATWNVSCPGGLEMTLIRLFLDSLGRPIKAIRF